MSAHEAAIRARQSAHEWPGLQGAWPVRLCSGPSSGVLMWPGPTTKDADSPGVGQKKAAVPHGSGSLAPANVKVPGPVKTPR